MKTRRSILASVLVLWVAFSLRVWGLGAQSLWYDEGYSAYLGAHLPLGEALDLTVRDIVPPLYYLFLRVWLPLVGTSEYALRFLSVLFGVVAVALMARIGHRLVRPSTLPASGRDGEWASLLSGALGAISPVLIWLSQDARMYGPLVTWSLLATWGLLQAVSAQATAKSRRRGWILFVGAGLAALYTHTVSAFWLVGQVVFVSLISWRQPRRKERMQDALKALALMAIGYLPWAIVALLSYRINAGYWPGYLPPAHLWRTAWEMFVGGQHLSRDLTGLAAVWFGFAALLGWTILLFRRPRVAVYLLCYLVIPLLAMGIAFQRTPKLAPRYPTAMAPALLLILSTGAAVAIRASRATAYTAIIPLLGVGLISLRADVNLYSEPDYAKDDWRAAASYVLSHREANEAVLLISGHAFPVFAYYYGWEGWAALPDDIQLDVNHVLDYRAAAPQLNQILAEAGGVWLVLWQEEVVDPTGLVPELLSDVGQELPTPRFQGISAGDRVTLRRFRFAQQARFAGELPVEHLLQQPVAPGLSVLGYTLPVRSPSDVADPIPADSEIFLRVFWQAEETLRGAHAASLRLFDRLDQEWARRDELLAGSYFSERWPVGTPVMGTYTVTLPPGTPPGVYQPTLMVYQGEETFETLQLSSLVITRPHSIPTLSALGLDTISPMGLGEAGGGVAQLSLVGVGFDQQTITPCQDWSLSLAWMAEGHPAQAYRLRLSAGPDEVETALAVDFPTTRWQPGDLWRTRHRLTVNCRALDGTFPVMGQLLDAHGGPVGDSLSLGEITIVAGRQFTVPPGLTAVLNVQLPDVGTLVGYQLSEDRVQPGENLGVTLYWRAGPETDHNYSVFAHLESDQVWAQHDSWPGEGKKPTSTWALGEIVEDHHPVPLGKDVPPGPYRLLVGMYDAATLQPVTAVDPNGRVIEGGRILLQPITVLPR